MKYYLSSFRYGDQANVELLKKMIPANKRLGHINNARDFVGRNPARAERHESEAIQILNQIGFQSEALDLKDYFGKPKALKEKLASLGAVWVSGGNSFVLRQAMHLSGFDQIFHEDLVARKDFLYGGYSAGICVLCSSLKPIEEVDDPFNLPYQELQAPIWEGLGVFNYMLLPHYDSDHPESPLVAQEIQRCIENKWLFKALRDGEVVIIE